LYIKDNEKERTIEEILDEVWDYLILTDEGG